MKIYIPKYEKNAWMYVFDGYANACQALGHTIIRFRSLLDLKPTNEDVIMSLDYEVVAPEVIANLADAKKIFIFVNPRTMPPPYNVFNVPHTPEVVEILNTQKNVWKWTYCEMGNNDYFSAYTDMHKLLLAVDDVAYQQIKDDNCDFDICFVGGLVNPSKAQRMYDFLFPLQDKYRCGFFGMYPPPISQEEEAKIIYNSKLALNVHDTYQLNKFNGGLMMDLNERTYKSLYLNGLLVMDVNAHHKELRDLIVFWGKNKQEYWDMIDNVFCMQDKLREEVRNENRKIMKEKHTYKERVKFLVGQI